MSIVLSRRDLLRTGAAASALLLVRPRGALAAPLGPRDAYGTTRASRLFPGTWVVHTDLHNHTLFSDGAGDAAEAFGSMRDAGLDVASLTDHSTVGRVVPGPFADGTHPCLGSSDCQSVAGMDEHAWRQTGELADAADVPGTFAAIRGFEWSSPTLGHMNVWFSERWSDPLSTGGLGSVEDLLAFAEEEGLEVAADAVAPLRQLVEATPAAGVGMAGWYAWCKQPPRTPGLGGGADALLGFNHPGREPFRFSDFAYDADLHDRVVSMEILNRREDYLYRVVRGRSPLVACLDAGWQPGLLGVTDEHGTDWGYPDGKGRAGCWVEELSRDGVRAAMLDRRFFATVLRGLRLDAAANGVRMGRALGHRAGPVTLTIDVDRGSAWVGKPLVAQVLTTGTPMPMILAAEPFRVPAADEPLPQVTVDVDADDTPWLVLRITDPEVAAPADAPDHYRGTAPRSRTRARGTSTRRCRCPTRTTVTVPVGRRRPARRDDPDGQVGDRPTLDHPSAPRAGRGPTPPRVRSPPRASASPTGPSCRPRVAARAALGRCCSGPRRGSSRSGGGRTVTRMTPRGTTTGERDVSRPTRSRVGRTGRARSRCAPTASAGSVSHRGRPWRSTGRWSASDGRPGRRG
jgi:hypothetical protein